MANPTFRLVIDGETVVTVLNDKQQFLSGGLPASTNKESAFYVLNGDSATLPLFGTFGGTVFCKNTGKTADGVATTASVRLSAQRYGGGANDIMDIGAGDWGKFSTHDVTNGVSLAAPDSTVPLCYVAVFA